MSNRLCIEPTEFKNTRTGEVTYGVRVYDNYGKAYSNTFESIPDDDMEILKMVVAKHDDDINDMFLTANDYKTGMTIGDTFYPHEQIEQYFAY